MTEHGSDKSGQGVPEDSVEGSMRDASREVKGAAGDVAREARAAGNALREDAAGIGSTLKRGLTEQAERQKNGIADRLSSLASRAQETADDLRQSEAWLGNLLGRGADELAVVADEIRGNDIPGILGSIEVFARRQPAVFMGATVALGFAVSRFVGSGPVEPVNHRADRQPMSRYPTDDFVGGRNP